MPKTITPLLFVPLLVAGLPGLGWSQNCPKILACPNGTAIICDATDNDSTFWNAAPFTWNPALQNYDLPETSVDLLLALRDTCPGTLSFQFTLFLDLDGDNLAESVLNSQQVLPAGQMLFGNAFAPGYTGSDFIEFDSRQVPDSLKYRFSVETQPSGDTLRAFLRWITDAAPTTFYTPRLPEGKHRILWNVRKNGVAVAFCEQSFRIKDCMAPQIQCHSSFNAGLPAHDTLWLSVPDFLQTAFDNTTPPHLLEFGLRRAGAGMGFPVDGLGQGISALPYTCDDLGLQFVELWVRDLAGNNSVCAGEFVLFDFLKTCTTADPIVCATSVFPNNDTIGNVYYEMQIVEEQGLPPVQLAYTQLANGCIELPDFKPYFIDVVGVTPHKNDDPLNGVSTYDLVLMNRHIIGMQLFNKTWKYLAADANNSGTLSTFDIIELRKLILGVYDSLPNNNSWKFVIADCALDSLQPFQSQCPGTLVFDPAFPPGQYLFMGIKIGDVNGNANPNLIPNEAQQRSPVALQIVGQQLEAGAAFEINITPENPVEWVGCQWALSWDPDLLEISDAEPGPVFNLGQAAFAFPKPGALRFNWFDAEARWLLPDMPLLRLRGKAKSALQLHTALHLTPTALTPEAYTATGLPATLDLVFSSNKKLNGPEAIYPPQPNPTTAGAIFPVYLEKQTAGILELWDAAGQLVFQNKTNLEAGTGRLEIPAATALPPGVYTWRIQVGYATKTGRLVCL